MLTALISIAFSSCEKEIPMNSFSQDFTIWSWSQSNQYFIGVKEIPELTQNVIDNGIVQVYYYGGVTPFQIPTSWSVANDVTIFLETAIRAGEIEIQISSDDWSYIESLGSWNFKIVIMAQEEF